MRWEGRPESSNVEYRQGEAEPGQGGGGDDGGAPIRGGVGLPLNLGGGGIGTIVIVLIVSWFLGINPLTLLGNQAIGPGDPQYERPVRQTVRTQPQKPRDEKLTRFISVVLRDTELRWSELLPVQAGGLVPKAAGMAYEMPTLVMSNGATRSPCGDQSIQTGPFYCPTDRKVYLDLNFFDVLRTRFQTTGEFAQAYVVAHEIGHHMQEILGILPAFNQARQRMSEVDANRGSVKIELQADCFAGVWAHAAQQDRDFIEPGDIDQALNAASKIGDDAIQKASRGTVVPDSFTHGTSEQRVRWFKTGFTQGTLASCDTFKAPKL